MAPVDQEGQRADRVRGRGSLRLTRITPGSGALRRSPAVPRLAVRETVSDAVRRNSVLRRMLVVADLLAVAGALITVVTMIGSDSVGPLTLLAVPAIVVVCKLCGLYDRDQYLLSKTTLDEAPQLFWVATLYTLLAFLAGDSLVNGHFGRDQAVLLWVMLIVFLVGFRYLARQFSSMATQNERCVVLGNASAASWLVAKLERSHRTNVDVIGRVSPSAQDTESATIARLGSCRELEEIVKKHKVDRVLIARGRGDPDHDVLAAIRIAKRLGVYVSVLPRAVEVVGAAVEFDDLEGATLLGVRRHGMTRSSQIVKRTFDLIGTAVLLVLAAPLMLVVAIAIKLDSRGPVFFRQPRVGRDDHPFRMYKFRTMIDGSDAQREALAHRNEAGGGLFKIENDPRITRVGGFLRRSSLDELPQLINVFKGDMSLVGPRPLVISEDERIEGWERSRLLQPPGVTGMWQVLGSARIPMTEMVKIDYLYGANWSLWLDIKILLRTVTFVLARRGL